jgi:hypothetical protein
MKKFFRQFFDAGRTSSSATPCRLTLECLEDRTVPATFDLTTLGASATVNNVMFQQTGTQPTGSGVIHSFVRLFSSGNAAMEQGYNTDARPLQYDENNSPVFTRSLQLSEVPVVMINGVGYREFLLDINQKHSSPLLSLDELRIYVGNAGNLFGYDPVSQQLAGLPAVYDLGAGNSLTLNAALSHGSGSGDVQVLVPDALLTAPGGNFIYLYSKFGATISTNGGFEEWAVNSQTTALSSLSGYVYHDDGSHTFNGTTGFNDVLVTLTGTTNSGVPVNVSQWTGVDVAGINGFYIFSGLEAGTYTITETTPTGFQADAANVGGFSTGTTTGAASPDFTLISNIVTPAGAIGRNYDFGLIQSGPPNT